MIRMHVYICTVPGNEMLPIKVENNESLEQSFRFFGVEEFNPVLHDYKLTCLGLYLLYIRRYFIHRISRRNTCRSSVLI